MLRGDILNAVVRVEVLDHGELVARGRALTRDDGRVSKEELPDLEKVSFDAQQ